MNCFSKFRRTGLLKFLAVALIALGTIPVFAAPGPNLLPAGNFENVLNTYVPWAGVDAAGNLHAIEGRQLMVGDSGNIGNAPFGPSVAVADLNGDGKNDLFLADSRGFFWYYPNSGTAQKPIFTQGEVAPIWLGEERVTYDTEGFDNVVPRIQLVDFSGTKKLDVVAGMYSGKLFHVPNTGSSTAPNFKPTVNNRDSLLINTRRHGMLWCNYLAPFFTSAFGSPAMDLVMGEGTYSANSIYLLKNTGSIQNPTFDEDHITKIIPGMGLEQLTPCVVDWNNDGKPDIVSGDRTGCVNLFLNNSTDPDHPTFAPGVRIKIGGVEKQGNSITATVCDLSGNNLPNLLIGRDDGTLVYAQNTGKLGAPEFNSAQPLKGVLPPSYHYTTSTTWLKKGANGEAYELISCVNPQLEPGFTFPEGEKSKYALKFSVWPYKNLYFPDRYLIRDETFFNQHDIECSQRFNLKAGARYKVHFWVKGDGPSEFLYNVHAIEKTPDMTFQPRSFPTNISAGSQWSEVTDSIRWDSNDPAIKTWSYWFEFRWKGQSTFYVDDVQITEDD